MTEGQRGLPLLMGVQGLAPVLGGAAIAVMETIAEDDAHRRGGSPPRVREDWYCSIKVEMLEDVVRGTPYLIDKSKIRGKNMKSLDITGFMGILLVVIFDLFCSNF